MVDSARFGNTITLDQIETKRIPDDVVCPCFYTGDHRYKCSYQSSHVIAGFNSGKGRIYFNCFAIEENLGLNPAADIMLMNFINYLG